MDWKNCKHNMKFRDKFGLATKQLNSPKFIALYLEFTESIPSFIKSSW